MLHTCNTSHNYYQKAPKAANNYNDIYSQHSIDIRQTKRNKQTKTTREHTKYFLTLNHILIFYFIPCMLFKDINTINKILFHIFTNSQTPIQVNKQTHKKTPTQNKIFIPLILYHFIIDLEYLIPGYAMIQSGC